MSAQEYLDKAFLIACKAHAGQKDKAGKPYILHPIRLAATFDRADYKACALLHDVLEDSSITIVELLADGIPEDVIEAIQLLTHKGPITDDAYHAYVRKLRINSMARAIKRADLIDNLDPLRMMLMKDVSTQRVKRYHKALRIISFLED